LVDGAVQLNWETAEETNNDYFTVERSMDGEAFKSILTVKGAGTAHETLNYSTTDYTPPQGKVYYRLKQTDFDGGYTYSKVIAITNDNESSLAFFPHPVKVGNTLNIKLQNHGTQANLDGATITIMDQFGKELPLVVIEEAKENIALKIPEALATGIYLMKIYGPNMRQVGTYKLIITH
jgi:hypothetical protein